MRPFLQAIFDGLASGAIYAALALALIMVHRATNIPNFAQGELAMLSAFVAWELQNRGFRPFGIDSMPWVVAFIMAILISFVIGFVIERAIIRWVEAAPPLTLIIITLGLFFVVNSGAGQMFGTVTKIVQTPWPTSPLQVGGAIISWDTIVLVAVLCAALGLVFALFRYTKLGLGLRGASMNAPSAKLVGISVGTMLGVGWGLACALGAIAGTMSAQTLGLQPNIMGSVLVFAFAGAVLGGLDSPVGAVVGGLTVGLLQAFLSTYWHPYGNSLSLVIAFGLIAVVLLLRPNGIFGRPPVVRV
ncbi:branched-chain amino acid ABC transporter permease [Dactylosporangium sp. NPDC051485]|uniref:branched-chain amino acid ABC transporter permease n=1 Tax=Dactylosporangium sp. NPDC051485 TaxID=3154846 RepID=UPI003424DC6A